MANGIMELQLGSLKNKTAPGINISTYTIRYVIIIITPFLPYYYLVCYPDDFDKLIRLKNFA